MKKFFTLICAMICAVAANAANESDIVEMKHSYVLVCDNYTGNGTVARVKGSIFGAKHFLDVTGGSIATNKGGANLADPTTLTALNGQDLEAFSAKYGKYGNHLNSLRLKNAQDVIAMKLTEGSKVIFVGQGNNKTGAEARIPKVATNAALTEGVVNEAPGADFGSTPAGYVYEVTVGKTGTYYVGSYNGDMFLSFIIVEANEALGTPMVEAGDQTFADGLWFAEVTCTPVPVTEEGESIATVVTYTTDGTEPTAESPVYKEPIKVYSDATVKFQAYYDWDGKGAAPAEEDKIDGADNEAVVTFSFNAPKLACENGVVTVTTEYEGATNMISVAGAEYAEGNSITLSESAIVSAKTVIKNGSYATFETVPASIDALVLTPITAEVTVTVSGEAVVDEEASATSTTGPVYVIENGVINADKMQFFNKGMQFKAIANADAKNIKYQVPAGQEAYMMFGNDSRLYFEIGCDTVDVEVVCSKNSCKTLNAEEDESVTSDRKIYVNVSGTTYGNDDITNGDVANLDGYQNVIKFGLKKGSYYFAKYSGTGNILLSSIKITPAEADGIKNVTTTSAAKVVKAIENGQLVIKSAKGTFNVAGAQMK
ncbi:MAG: chitobiase/beta-hexosaminidase C-terminal domain-containing protein [Prevotella sp.]|nr:chitobiase/beta-hexosaminidase C-terminal domain-containing protein [Prevotella sp.]